MASANPNTTTNNVASIQCRSFEQAGVIERREFTKFPKLPTELRLKVWAYVLPGKTYFLITLLVLCVRAESLGGSSGAVNTSLSSQRRVETTPHLLLNLLQVGFAVLIR